MKTQDDANGMGHNEMDYGNVDITRWSLLLM
jgi:hypothetical protein